MGLSDYIASVATDMKATNLQMNVGNALMSKAMDVTETAAAGIIDMMDDIPTFPGDVGSLFNARA